MPYVTKQIWIDEDDGPNAFLNTPLINQMIWDGNSAAADHEVCSALRLGGFHDDYIRRRVGNYEGQIMAIRRGYVEKDPSAPGCYRITASGREFMKAQGQAEPIFLSARDDWHGKDFEYCLWEHTRDGKPYLKFAKELFPRLATGMNPLFSRDQAIALRDHINDWLERTKPALGPWRSR